MSFFLDSHLGLKFASERQALAVLRRLVAGWNTGPYGELFHQGEGGGGAVIPICEVSTQMSMHSKSYQLDACLWPSHKGHTLRFTRLYMAVAASPGHALFRLKNN